MTGKEKEVQAKRKSPSSSCDSRDNSCNDCLCERENATEYTFALLLQDQKYVIKMTDGKMIEGWKENEVQ